MLSVGSSAGCFSPSKNIPVKQAGARSVIYITDSATRPVHNSHTSRAEWGARPVGPTTACDFRPTQPSWGGVYSG